MAKDHKSLSNSLERLCLTQTEFASMFGVTTRAVTLWIAGKRKVPAPAWRYIELLRNEGDAFVGKELMRTRREDGWD